MRASCPSSARANRAPADALESPPAEEVGAVRLTPLGDDEIEFAFSDTCWVEVKDLDGNYLHASLGEPNGTLLLVGQGPFDIKLGLCARGGAEIQRRTRSPGPALPGASRLPSAWSIAVIRSLRGMRDVLPEEARRWRVVEDAIVDVLERFAYEEVRLPLLEATDLFSRSIGAATDIVEKEMFSLTDRGRRQHFSAPGRHGFLHARPA